MVAGLQHARDRKGMAFIEILSPCVTYNDTYPHWMNMVHDVDADPDYDATHRGRAFAANYDLVMQSRIPIGLIFSGTHASLQSSLVGEITPFHALDAAHSEKVSKHLQNVVASYTV